MAKSKPRKRVLVVDHGSAFTKKLVKMYQGHPDIQYDVQKVKAEKVEDTDLSGFDIVHMSGSRRKKNLNDEVSEQVLKKAGKDTYVIGTCYAAQTMAKHYGVDSKRLDKYQQGKQEIDMHASGDKLNIHKEHRWGIPVTPVSRLEKLASSAQTFDNGKKGTIYEMFRAKSNHRHIGIQGHAEQGVGKNIMYQLLNEIHGEQYKRKAA